MVAVSNKLAERRMRFAILLVFLSILSLTMGVENGKYVADTVQGQATGSVSLTAAAATLSVTSRVISSSNCGTSCGSGNNITGAPRPAVTAANNEEWWSASVSDSGGLSDIDGITIYIYKGPDGTKGTFNMSSSYGFRWVRKGYSVVTAGAACSPGTGTPAGCFQELSGSGWVNSFTYLVSADSSRPTWTSAGSASGQWTFAATLSSLALYTDNGATNHWNFEADETSKSGAGTKTRTGTFDMNMYLSLTLPSANISNGTAISPGSVNQNIGTTTWTYTSNAPINVQMLAGQNLTNQYGDQIPITDITVGSVHPAGGCTGSTCITLSLSNQNYQINQPVEVSPTNTIYWYLSAPAVVVPGAYTTTYTVTIVWNNQYPT